jgi:hypothetical protein
VLGGYLSGTVNSGPAAERLKELLGYVEQVVRLDERPAFRLAEFRLPMGQTFVFHQHEFHALLVLGMTWPTKTAQSGFLLNG